MANPSKARGTAWESAIRDFTNAFLGLYKDDWRDLPASQRFLNMLDWRNVKRQAQEGAKDVGDLHAWPFILEAKDVKSPAVPTWLRQAEAEAVNAGFPYGVVIHKTRGKGPGMARVHISDAAYCRLLDTEGVCVPGPVLNTRGGYWTWSLAGFAQVLAAVRGTSTPVTQ
ncbi:hypothetical protein ACKI1S_28010 [Streptomyces galilaeus]|uniref:Restriction endonuclease n=1 Tax=Streptomyces galilaeus TaxID=33899 RepID=A0ABW9INA1_STRGJ